MFCRKCGKTLLDGDRFCSYCGAQVIERNESISKIGENVEEVIYNNQATIEIPVKELRNIGVPEKTIAQTWHEINEKNIEHEPKPHWNLEGFPALNEETKKTEDIKVDWGKRELLKFELNPEKMQENIKPPTRETEPSHTGKRENKPDIFEIFDKQMHEEKELERKDRDTLVFRRKTPEQEKEEVPEHQRAAETAALEQELFKSGIKNDKVHTSAEEQIDKFYTFSKKNEEFQKLLDKEYERLKKEPEFVRPEPKIPSNIEKLELNEPVDVPFKAILGNHPEKTEEDIPTDAALKMDTEIHVETDTSTKEQASENKQQRDLVQESEDIKTAEETVLPWAQMESPLAEFSDEKQEKKWSPMAIALAIIIALLVFEIAILGIKYFLPESSAAGFINDKLGVAVNWVDSFKDGQTPEEQKEDNKDKEDTKEASAPAQPDPTPNSDKSALIAEALAYNANIKSITADDSLVYMEQKDYGDRNINNSKTIENNIWYQDENGNTVYYDKEIVKTIIQFDSSWIDYVNKKDASVLEFTKEGSPASQNAKKSKLVGKVTETFDSLKIGEIRQGAERGFYIWVYESITINQSGTDSTNNYNYVYYLEPVEKQMKIVSYKKL
ncbi:zinc ribbon domain-containing protein [Aminipila sp.]|uniref:zinc ribbon domain-containing protein n=1 Tax=Aminipila sp. TaxID=2060095 RepID=UPI0028A19391|nr:zinc ribbon domain-containing protein [Aminipila sp.]